MRTITYQFIQAAGSTSDLRSKTRFTSFSTSLWFEHSPSGCYSFGAHGGRLPPGDLGHALSRRLTDPPPRSTGLVTTSGPAFKNARPGWFTPKREKS